MPETARNVLILLSVILTVVTCTTGMTSIKQCYKYNDIPISLRELDSYTAPSKQDLDRILEEEAREEITVFRKGRIGRSLGYPTDTNEAVGGVEALPLEHKFMAALGYGNDTNKKYLCGGTLISEEYVLTAAHCIFSPERGMVQYIRLGDHNIRSIHDDANVRELKIDKYYIHPNYTVALKYHDIALIKLKERVAFTLAIGPVCLEHERQSLKYEELIATGWGLLGFGEPASETLQEVRLRQYTPKSCQKAYNLDPKLPSGFVDDHQICAGTIVNITDTCEGDSGGPLMYMSRRNGPNIKYLVGITSFGVPCGIAEIPAVYTRVSYYIDWIEKIVWP